MAAITNLYAKIGYDASKTDAPVLLWMHGWDGQGADRTNQELKQMAAYGFFVCHVGMRGRDGADGARDASGREIYDIIDALTYIRTNYAAYVSSTQAAIVGYSGGGGNALACACKFPDTFSVVVDFYGMSDYGRDGTYGWYQENPVYQAAIATAIGDTPTNVPNNYYARDATAAIQNFTGGKLHLFHDSADATVKKDQSDRIVTAMDNASLTNYSTHYTSAADSIRWTHGAAELFDAAGLSAKTIWTPDALAQAAWTIPTSGTVTVIGYIVTKRFTIWLNVNGTATTGIDAAATVVYNTATDTYTVTPLVSGIDVSITQGAKTGSATNISAETPIVVA